MKSLFYAKNKRHKRKEFEKKDRVKYRRLHERK